MKRTCQCIWDCLTLSSVDYSPKVKSTHCLSLHCPQAKYVFVFSHFLDGWERSKEENFPDT